MKSIKQKMTAIDLIVAKATEIANLRAVGKEREALSAEAELTQIRSEASRTAAPYDPFTKHAQLAKFTTSKALWDQVRRGAHSDRGGTNSVASLATQFEAIHAAATAAGTSMTGMLFECAKRAQSTEADHALTFRNNVAITQNEELVRGLLVETHGDIEAARALAKSRRVKWAPIYATTDAESATSDGEGDAPVEPDTASEHPLNGADHFDADLLDVADANARQ